MNVQTENQNIMERYRIATGHGARTLKQAQAFFAAEVISRPTLKKRDRHFVRERRPVPFSAEWCETRGDDLGESPDY